MKNATLRALLAVSSLALAACCGRSRSEAFKALDKHRIAYGQCELMSQSKGQINGQEPWLAASVCRMKHRQTVLAELSDTKNFEDHFDAWKKEKGARAVEDARSSPAPTTGSGGGSDCPNGADCMNRCRSECEAKHGKMMDTARIAACARSGKKPDECVSAGSNPAATSCFRSCRGI